jgi:hypothetical protein
MNYYLLLVLTLVLKDEWTAKLLSRNVHSVL